MRWKGLGVVSALAVLALSGCSVTARGTPPVRPVQPAPSSTTAPATAAWQPGANTALVAYGNSPSIPVFTAPGETSAFATMPNPWYLNGAPNQPIPQAFLVLRRSGQWVEVQLPQRPNGTTGWVPLSAVKLLSDPWRVEVGLTEHRITISDDGATYYSGAVATGAPATPTPVGTFYVRVLLHSSDPTSVYGPYAFGLSAHSEALDTFDGGDAEIGLHGNDDSSVLGQSVSHGCIRMDNAEITRLAGFLPLGTPVQIDP